MTIQEFRKKPLVIKAMKFDGHNGSYIRSWSEGKCYTSPVLEPSTDNPTGIYMQIKTIDSIAIAIPGDWIIRGTEGEFYPCKPGIFEKTYEPVNP